MISFEFDETKSRSNKIKHGIDFNEAKILWDDPDLMEIPARKMEELRGMIIGKYKDKLWTAIFTYRRDSIRIISVRRARLIEEKVYES